MDQYINAHNMLSYNDVDCYMLYIHLNNGAQSMCVYQHSAVGVYCGCLVYSSEKIEKDREILVKN